MAWDDLGNFLNKIDDKVCWWLAVALGYIKAIWQRAVWHIRWPFLWLGYRARQFAMFFRTLKLTASYVEDEGKHTVILRLKWQSEEYF